MPVLAGADEARNETGEMDPREITFRRLQAADLALMQCWLNTPYIRRWWYDEGTSYQEIEDKYLPRIEGQEPVRPFVVLHEERPVGFIQYYPISAEGDETYAGLVDVKNSAGVDLLIGEPEYLYRGFGSHVIRRFLSEYVFSDPSVEVCVIGPEPKNVAAIRAYEKAGFRYFKTIQVPGEPEPEYFLKLTREEFEENELG